MKLSSGGDTNNTVMVWVWQRLAGDIQGIFRDAKGITILEYGASYLKIKSTDSFNKLWSRIGSKILRAVKSNYKISDMGNKNDNVVFTAIGVEYKIVMVQPEKNVFILTIEK